MNTIERDKKILGNAPEECTHHRPEHEYEYDNLGFEIRALSDIETIIKQHEEIERLNAQNYKLRFMVENGLGYEDLANEI